MIFGLACIWFQGIAFLSKGLSDAGTKERQLLGVSCRIKENGKQLCGDYICRLIKNYQ